MNYTDYSTFFGHSDKNIPQMTVYTNTVHELRKYQSIHFIINIKFTYYFA